MGNKEKVKVPAKLASAAFPLDADTLVHDLKQMIDDARSAVAATVNIGLTLLYWQVGKCINIETLKGGRAEYGKKFLPRCRNN